ncbi:hypothetical protein D3C72_2339510 [compost metagenome]
MCQIGIGMTAQVLLEASQRNLQGHGAGVILADQLTHFLAFVLAQRLAQVAAQVQEHVSVSAACGTAA